jgi:hypothetical protein
MLKFFAVDWRRASATQNNGLLANGLPAVSLGVVPRGQVPVRMTCSGVWPVNDKGGLRSLSMMLQQNT